MMQRLVGMFGVLVAAAAVPIALWLSTTERHVASAAKLILPIITPDDLVIIDGNLVTHPDPGGLIRPFAPFASVVMNPDEALPELQTFPQKRFFLVGKHWDALAGEGARKLADDVLVVEPRHDGEMIVAMTDALQVAVEQNGTMRACSQRHPNGGVRCGSQPWQYVAPSVVTANGKRIACLWSHPVHQHRLHINVPVQAPAQARLWLQFADEALNDSPHPPVFLNAFVDGNLVGGVTCTNEKPGRCPLVVDVKSDSVKLTIETADAARQLVCLGGEIGPAR